MSPEPGFEHIALRGITIKNMIVTVVCTATLVITVMNYKGAIERENALIELRVHTIEDQIQIIQKEISELNANKK